MPTKKQYARLKKEGRCTKCNYKLDRVGLTCVRCTEKIRKKSVDRRLKYQAEGKCPRCGKPSDEGDTTSECVKCTTRRHTYLFRKYPGEEFK